MENAGCRAVAASDTINVPPFPRESDRHHSKLTFPSILKRSGNSLPKESAGSVVHHDGAVEDSVAAVDDGVELQRAE
jgi:hypothetical protein